MQVKAAVRALLMRIHSKRLSKALGSFQSGRLARSVQGQKCPVVIQFINLMKKIFLGNLKKIFQCVAIKAFHNKCLQKIKL